jgi:hypothetical protein
MENEFKEVPREGLSAKDREFYIEGAILTALSMAIALVAM